MSDYRTAPVDSQFKQLLHFTEKIARDAGQITAEDIAKVRAAGFTDRAVLDTVHVAGFFSYMNRVIQAIGADGKLDSAPQSNTENWSGAYSVEVHRLA
jgi:alkylhydroperoxidase family enzyme